MRSFLSLLVLGVCTGTWAAVVAGCLGVVTMEVVGLPSDWSVWSFAS